MMTYTFVSSMNQQTMSKNQSKSQWSAGLIYMERDSLGRQSLHILPPYQEQRSYETIDDLLSEDDDFWNQFPEPDWDDPIIGQFWSSIISRN